MPNKAQKRNGPARSESSMMCWSIRAIGFSTTRVFNKTISAMSSSHGPSKPHLHLDMPKVNTQLLQQWRLSRIAFCPKRSQPSRRQPILPCAHASRDTSLCAKCRAIVLICVALTACAIALEWCTLARHRLAGVRGLVEVQVVLRRVVALLLRLAVTVGCHVGVDSRDRCRSSKRWIRVMNVIVGLVLCRCTEEFRTALPNL